MFVGVPFPTRESAHCVEVGIGGGMRHLAVARVRKGGKGAWLMMCSYGLKENILRLFFMKAYCECERSSEFLDRRESCQGGRVETGGSRQVSPFGKNRFAGHTSPGDDVAAPPPSSQVLGAWVPWPWPWPVPTTLDGTVMHRRLDHCWHACLT